MAPKPRPVIKSWLVVDGYAETRKALNKCLGDEAKKELSGAIRDGLKDIVLPVAKDECPVRSGDLRNTLAVRSQVTKAGIKAGSTKILYAGPIHWGWPDRNIKENRFVYRALDKTYDRLINFFIDTFEVYERQCSGKINRNRLGRRK